MGGSGSRGWAPSVPSSHCQRLRFIATVNSPNPAALPTLQLGQVLSIRLQAAPSAAVVHTGVVDIGSLTAPQVPELIGCMQKGFEYEATITKISGGRLEVEVAHV